MKKIFLSCMALVISMMAFGQAKKPTIMVVPSQNWCYQNGYIKTFAENGETKKVPDYERAFLENSDVKTAISCINDMMAEANFPLKDMEQYLSSLSLTRAENAAATSKSGGEVAESPLDIINARAKSDIIFELTWTVNKRGPLPIISVRWMLIPINRSQQSTARAMHHHQLRWQYFCRRLSREPCRASRISCRSISKIWLPMAVRWLW